ncbi:MAG: hypothetical protein CO094_11960 [Anaerolineae bacterium CG_4_9_14_3_um_filter_57_17]|nr:undecaprenyl/decaprenyl-phosphate alpha-N-acetylglucosaminyl 1-phosphate transferase [bacterium]NCT20281.1 undecaprenyl/decaprenyl-phosphate alpha-N-acetylglucosaminyl 1-phosphate transferase [bacterium]OIO84760.1 MAG: hypothetical protein AUK01_08060 [Anaerolineae bacterium CG2_30_57_67]PJB64693.1 MAG: hypothetical protein CO094_11960 [Anaerolineae bacterium CG_4_9_14_3_um_filter_57_17]
MTLQLDISALTLIAAAIPVSILFNLLISPFAIALTRRLGLIDIPGSSPHKQHAVPTPLAGGLILMVSLPLLITLFGLWQRETILLVVAASIVFLFGLLDDQYGFSATQKFAGQTLASLLLLWGNISVHFFDALLLQSNPTLTVWLNAAVTLFWLVGVINAFNLTDSMDGLASGLAAIASGFCTIFSLASGQTSIALLSAIVLGISVSLYAINITPARSFLGDSGAQTLGFLLAAIGILYDPLDAPQGSTWFVPVLLVGVPIFDTTLVTLSRLRRGKPIFHADLGHTYHRLVRAGFSAGQAVLCLQLVAFLLSNLAFLAIFLPPPAASGLFIFICLLGLAGIAWLEIKVGVGE